MRRSRVDKENDPEPKEPSLGGSEKEPSSSPDIVARREPSRDRRYYSPEPVYKPVGKTGYASTPEYESRAAACKFFGPKPPLKPLPPSPTPSSESTEPSGDLDYRPSVAYSSQYTERDYRSPDRDYRYPDRDYRYPDRDNRYPDRDYRYPDRDYQQQEPERAPSNWRESDLLARYRTPGAAPRDEQYNAPPPSREMQYDDLSRNRQFYDERAYGVRGGDYNAPMRDRYPRSFEHDGRMQDDHAYGGRAEEFPPRNPYDRRAPVDLPYNRHSDDRYGEQVPRDWRQDASRRDSYDRPEQAPREAPSPIPQPSQPYPPQPPSPYESDDDIPLRRNFQRETGAPSPSDTEDESRRRAWNEGFLEDSDFSDEEVERTLYDLDGKVTEVKVFPGKSGSRGAVSSDKAESTGMLGFGVALLSASVSMVCRMVGLAK